jgi:hypothetical protein
VTVRDGRIGSASSFGSAIIFTTEVPADLILEGNAIRSIGNQDPSVQVNATAPGGVTSVSVIANRVTQHGHDNGGSGISLGLGGAGAFRADVMNNTVWDVAGCNCASSVDIQLENSVNADINIVGNTMEGSVGSGIALRNDLDAGGGVALDVFDNIISHQDFAGILLEDGGGTLTYRGGYNDFFANGFEDFDGHAPGPATLHVDPKFVNRTAGNLKLKPSSPLIDAGLVCTPGGVADPDAAGRHRLAGPTVDFGAYEFGAALPAGIVHVGDATAEAIEGTSGADILCGYGGGDFIEGKGGSDYLDGGPGGDVIFGGSGSDLLFGRGGADLLCARDGTGGNDRLDGGKGTDQYRADGGDIRISVEQTASCAHQ